MELPARRAPTGPARRDDDAETVHAILQSTTWCGPWEPPEAMRVVSVLGKVVLDYREVALPPGLTVLDCLVVLGHVEILLPPEVDLELTGSLLLGSVEATDDVVELAEGTGAAEERPVLAVECAGALGHLEVRRG